MPSNVSNFVVRKGALIRGVSASCVKLINCKHPHFPGLTSPKVSNYLVRLQFGHLPGAAKLRERCYHLCIEHQIEDWQHLSQPLAPLTLPLVPAFVVWSQERGARSPTGALLERKRLPLFTSALPFSWSVDSAGWNVPDSCSPDYTSGESHFWWYRRRTRYSGHASTDEAVASQPR